jgi:hypothetical protein
LKNCHSVTNTNRRRFQSSRRSACPFSLVGARKDEVWTLRVQNGKHNHGPSSAKGHSTLRKLDKAQKVEVECFASAGMKPRNIEARIVQGLHNSRLRPLQIRDIYNFRQNIEREMLGGLIPVQFLFRQFNVNDYVWEYKTDAENPVTHLVFASHKSLSLFMSFPEVLLLDCTYQTNRFGMPLLNMVGVANVSTSFHVDFSFIESEAEDDYRWVLEQLPKHLNCTPGNVVTDCDQALSNALSYVFPDSYHTLCRWHICRSVLSRCKRHFSTPRSQGAARRTANPQVEAFIRDWDDVTFSASVAKFRAKWQKVQRSYRRERHLINYLHGTWMPL